MMTNEEIKNLTTESLQGMKSSELKELGKKLQVHDWWNKKKEDLVKDIMEKVVRLQEFIKSQEKPVEPQKQEKPVKEKKQKVVKEPKGTSEPKQSKEGISEEDLVTIKDIVGELKIKGTKARRILRNNNIERPYKRWEWHKEEHRDIIEKIKGLLSK